MEIRRSYGRLISTMAFPVLVRSHLYIESGPCISMTCPCFNFPGAVYAYILNWNLLWMSWCHHPCVCRNYRTLFTYSWVNFKLLEIRNYCNTTALKTMQTWSDLDQRYFSPVHWWLFSHISDLVEILFFFNSTPGHEITTNFCTCYGRKCHMQNFTAIAKS